MVASPSWLATVPGPGCGSHQGRPGSTLGRIPGIPDVFACSGPITGYQVLPDHQVQSIETEVFATDPKTKDVVPSDSFSCNGDLPGWGVNCNGTYGGGLRVVTGSFEIDGKLCAEPRVDPLLTVTYATADAQRKITQFIAGPFDLGRPLGCKPTNRNGHTRLPRETDEPAG